MTRNQKLRSILAPSLFALSAAVLAAHDAPLEPAAETAAPDIAQGEAKAQVCIACHGEQGISQQDNYPHLHGQRQTYLLRQMRMFRDHGDRRDPIMTPMLENMSDQDLVNLAAYFSSFNRVLNSKSFHGPAVEKPMPTPEVSEQAKAASAVEGDTESPDTGDDSAPAAPAEAAPAAAPAVAGGAGDAAAGKTKSAACAGCHGADGRGTSPLFPNLNGQKPEYLVRQLQAFRDGKRQDPSMAPMAAALTDQDIADLAAFYSSLK